MTYQTAQSPWDTVNNPPENVQEYFGEVTISAWWCMLASGFGKLPYDEKSIDPKTGEPPRKYTAIDLSIMPIAESNLTYEIKRQMLAEFGEWKDIVWPNLRSLGVLDAAALNGKFAQVEMVKTGREYQGQNGKREATTFKFIQLFDTREECAAAYKMKHGGNGSVSEQQQPLTDNSEKTFALAFVDPLIGKVKQQAEGDLGKMRELLAKEIANQGMINKYFTVDSPEIVELMAKELEK